MAQLTLDFDAGAETNPVFKAFKRPQSERKPNPLKDSHPFRDESPAIYDLGKNAEMLKQEPDHQLVIDAYKDSGTKVDFSLSSKVGRVRLGDLKIHPHIQRELDAGHCTRISKLGFFDPQMMGIATAMLTSKGVWYLCDHQHTLTCIISFIQAGLVEGYDGDWEDYEVAVVYIETDDIGVGVRWFNHQNGFGKKAQTQFKELQTATVLVDQYNSKVPEFVAAERAVAILEQYGCYAAAKGSNYKEDSTYSHIAVMRSCSEEVLHNVGRFHSAWFADYVLDSHTFTTFKYFESVYSADDAGSPSDMLIEQCAGMLQKLFVDMSGFRVDCGNAWDAFNTEVYGTKIPWQANVVPVVLLQLYVELGGGEYVPQIVLDEYTIVREATKKKYRVSDFLSESTRKEIEKYLESDDKEAA